MSDTSRRAELVLDLFDRYYERVYCFVRKSVPAEQAEDVVQEVFARLLQLPQLEKMTLSVSYLIKIADNLLKRRYARTKRFGHFLEVVGPRQSLLCESIESERAPAISAGDMERAMDSLTSDERDAVRLIVCMGMSYEDAARSLGVTVSTINNWKYRGLRKLQQHATNNDGTDRSAGQRARSLRSCHGRGDLEQAAPARVASRGYRGVYEPDSARRTHRRVASV